MKGIRRPGIQVWLLLACKRDILKTRKKRQGMPAPETVHHGVFANWGTSQEVCHDSTYSSTMRLVTDIKDQLDEGLI